MTKIFTSIGLMSGTSLDGVDASLIQSDGESKLNIMENLYIPYTKSLKFGIKELKRKINKARELIQTGRFSMTEIAYELEFSSLAHLINLLKK